VGQDILLYVWYSYAVSMAFNYIHHKPVGIDDETLRRRGPNLFQFFATQPPQRPLSSLISARRPVSVAAASRSPLQTAPADLSSTGRGGWSGYPGTPAPRGSGGQKPRLLAPRPWRCGFATRLRTGRGSQDRRTRERRRFARAGDS
jgi:hypothetical protein